jgi:hypothetical protein
VGLYKITSNAPVTPSDVESVIVNADNDNEAVEIATSPPVMPGDLGDRARWVALVVVDYLGVTYPASRPAGVIAVERWNRS